MKITYSPTRAPGPLAEITSTVYAHLEKVGEARVNDLVKTFTHPRSETYRAIEELRKLNAIVVSHSSQQLEQQQAA